MKLRNKLAALAFMTATLATTTVMATPASAHHYSDHVYACKKSQVFHHYDWFTGHSYGYLETSANLYKSSGSLSVNTKSWTTGAFGFHGASTWTSTTAMDSGSALPSSRWRARPGPTVTSATSTPTPP